MTIAGECWHMHGLFGLVSAVWVWGLDAFKECRGKRIDRWCGHGWVITGYRHPDGRKEYFKTGQIIWYEGEKVHRYEAKESGYLS